MFNLAEQRGRTMDQTGPKRKIVKKWGMIFPSFSFLFQSDLKFC